MTGHDPWIREAIWDLVLPGTEKGDLLRAAYILGNDEGLLRALEQRPLAGVSRLKLVRPETDGQQ